MGLSPWWEVETPYLEEISVEAVQALSGQASDWVNMGEGGLTFGAGAGM